MTLTVRAITPAQHADWITQRESVSFLQLPEWGQLKTGWRSESLGWFEGSRLIGAGLVLYRPVPRLPQRSLAYLPEGPDIDWYRAEHPHLSLDDWLQPLLAHCRAKGAFQVKMGPPVALRRWHAETIKAAMAEWNMDTATRPPRRISEVLADWHSGPGAKAIERLRTIGWTQETAAGAGFGDVQPRFVFQVPLDGRTLDDVFAGFNQLWRRNIRKAEKAGVMVTRGTRDDLAAFHEVYVETAHRDHFTPRGVAYFERMWDSLNSREERLSLYCAHIDGHLAAATIMVQVGTHAWYSYGASTTADRDVRPSNALQWRMIRDAHAAGCDIYDLRGIADTLDPANHLFGLVQFKVGTGGFAQEYAGEWDFILRPAWAKGFRAYQSRRG
jgi:lipid II:glycine glycyltransferase (peptidoglycan interpeptide bridge formation enzyme)